MNVGKVISVIVKWVFCKRIDQDCSKKFKQIYCTSLVFPSNCPLFVWLTSRGTDSQSLMNQCTDERAQTLALKHCLLLIITSIIKTYTTVSGQSNCVFKKVLHFFVSNSYNFDIFFNYAWFNYQQKFELIIH